MWLEAVKLLFLTALFWGAIPSNCQGYCFETQGVAQTRSKSWLSGEQDSFQRRVLFLDSCYVLTTIDTGTRYDFHSGSLILSTHWFAGSCCDAAVQVEFSFECIPGICGRTSAWVQNGRPNHLTNSECIRGDGRRCESKMDGRTIWRTWVSFGQSDTVAPLVWLVLWCSSTSRAFPFWLCMRRWMWAWVQNGRPNHPNLCGWMQHESEASWHIWCVCVLWTRPWEPNHKFDYDVWIRPWEPNHKFDYHACGLGHESRTINVTMMCGLGHASRTTNVCLCFYFFSFWRPWTKHESEPWMESTVKPSSPQWWWLEGSVSVYTYMRHVCVMCVTCVQHVNGEPMLRIIVPLDQRRLRWYRLCLFSALENMLRVRITF
jgi:hypothetical protein